MRLDLRWLMLIMWRCPAAVQLRAFPIAVEKLRALVAELMQASRSAGGDSTVESMDHQLG
ncbi:MAG: hypothetical protein ACRDRY_18705 [Pseudonocardiaceae bacterium]